MILLSDRQGHARRPGHSDRTLVRVHAPTDGPTLVCVGGVHGNEPAGVIGIDRVGRRIRALGGLAAGDFVGLVGNRAALARGERFLDRDLNRAWTEDRVARAQAGALPAPTTQEDREQAELLAAIDEVVGRARGPVYLLDLHTTSGSGGIFSVFGDALQHRAFASAFPVPMVLGLEELVDGTLTQFFGERGFVTVTVETGQHEAPESVDCAEAVVWVGLEALGMLPTEARGEAEHGQRLLRRASAHLPPALEMRHRHPILPGDAFEMLPGFRNFDRVMRGEVVARDRHGEIRVTETSRILMPLYQRQGEDGFFLVRRFSPFWMVVSALLRRARVDRVAHLLPGVERIPGDPDAVRVDRRIARHYARQLFHLLGFRRIEEDGRTLIMRRRREPPS